MYNEAVAEAETSEQPGAQLSHISPVRRSIQANKIALAVFIWLALVQASMILWMGNGLSPTGDPYGEADIIRSAQHYADYGFRADAALPHITYGKRFPHDGWVTDEDRFPLRSGVYTRYPPLPNLIAGAMERIVGFQRLWLWRVVPIACGLAALLYAFFALRAATSPKTAAVVLTLVALAPMTSTHMHALHYEGYAQALLVAGLGLLARTFFSGAVPGVRTLSAVCVIAFLQGCFSFDYFFVTAGAVIPIALLARAHGRQLRTRHVVLIAFLSAASFTAAHLLHFWQVEHFYGSITGALQDFSSRAQFRFSGEKHVPYVTNLIATLIVYARIIWLEPESPHFGPILAVLTFAIPAFLTRKPASAKNATAALQLSYVVAALWLFVMPAHSLIHTHIIPRLFFLAYFVASLDLALRLTVGRPELQAAQ